MRAVKGKGTRLEKRLWAMLAGLRLKGWKKNADDVVGKPDVVFLINALLYLLTIVFGMVAHTVRENCPQQIESTGKGKLNAI